MKINILVVQKGGEIQTTIYDENGTAECDADYVAARANPENDFVGMLRKPVFYKRCQPSVAEASAKAAKVQVERQERIDAARAAQTKLEEARRVLEAAQILENEAVLEAAAAAEVDATAVAEAAAAKAQPKEKPTRGGRRPKKPDEAKPDEAKPDEDFSVAGE